jgi:hypothetical protein
MARYYLCKYGKDVIQKLERDAAFCEVQESLHQRNKLLRVRDTILLEFGGQLQTGSSSEQWQHD